MPLLLGSDTAALHEAARYLREGRVVAFPTDTLYGLAVDPRDPAAVRRLFALKGREEASPLPLIASSVEQADRAGALGPLARRIAARWWPGPLTIVVDARAGLARETLAGRSSVGVRVPNHPIARALADAFGFCITSTSANQSGASPALTADEVLRQLPAVDVVIDGGPAPGGPPSTIVRVLEERMTLVRDGAVAWKRVLESLQ